MNCTMALSVTETCIQTAQDKSLNVRIVKQQMSNGEEHCLIIIIIIIIAGDEDLQRN